MLKKFKEICMVLGMFSLLTAPMLVTATVSADIAGGVACGAELKVSTTNCDPSANTGGPDIGSILTLVVNIFSIVVGFVAVIMIIVGGFKYITSGGDSGNISGAKNTIIFALVGLVIVALAQVIVRFVLTKVSGANVSNSGL